MVAGEYTAMCGHRGTEKRVCVCVCVQKGPHRSSRNIIVPFAGLQSQSVGLGRRPGERGDRSVAYVCGARGCYVMFLIIIIIIVMIVIIIISSSSSSHIVVIIIMIIIIIIINSNNE